MPADPAMRMSLNNFRFNADQKFDPTNLGDFSQQGLISPTDGMPQYLQPLGATQNQNAMANSGYDMGLLNDIFATNYQNKAQIQGGEFDDNYDIFVDFLNNDQEISSGGLKFDFGADATPQQMGPQCELGGVMEQDKNTVSYIQGQGTALDQFNVQTPIHDFQNELASSFLGPLPNRAQNLSGQGLVQLRSPVLKPQMP